MRLPKISDIQAFEVAARHMNFTKAGEELSLTSSAVSQRVSALEQGLGFVLFHRAGPKLELTEDGEICRPVLRQALMHFRDTIGSLQALTQNRVLTIKASPSFAEKWLNPRLGKFEALNPEIDLRIWSAPVRIDTEDGSPCLSISYGIDPARGVPANHVVELLFEEEVFPVCSPDYLARHGPFEGLQDLGQMKLLHDDNMEPMRSFPNWRRWCSRFNIGQIDTNRGPRFTISSMVVNAAAEGRGIALARSALVQAELQSGQLIRPFDEIFPLSFGYYLVYPRSLAEHSDFKPLRSWLIAEAASQPGKSATFSQ